MGQKATSRGSSAAANLSPALHPDQDLRQKNAVLATAIETVQPHRLRHILKGLCLASERTEKHVAAMLLTTAPPEEEEEEEEEGRPAVSRKRSASDAADPLLAKRPMKRLRPRFTMCEQCGREFNVSLNSEKVCRWHPGTREPDLEGDFWADHDENCHGRISDLEDEKDYSEGFFWDCCGKTGDDQGCERDVHRATVC